MLRDLRAGSGKESKPEDVAEIRSAKMPRLCLYASPPEERGDQWHSTRHTGQRRAPAALLSGKGRYTKITWVFQRIQAAFLSDRDDAAGKPAKFSVPMGPQGRSAGRNCGRRDSAFAPASPWPTAEPSRSRAMARDFPELRAGGLDCRRRRRTPGCRCRGRGATPDKAVADLWNWKDDYVQPMQKVRAAQDRRGRIWRYG
jgi:hypothetical protein